jgi:hypothetical protein
MLRFMPADAYWTLAMAVNVYLTFYWKYDAEALRKLEKYYIMICYGAPFVPAFVYLWLVIHGMNGFMLGRSSGALVAYGGSKNNTPSESTSSNQRISTRLSPVPLAEQLLTSRFCSG